METMERQARPVEGAIGLSIAPLGGVNVFTVSGPVLRGADESGGTVYYCGAGPMGIGRASWPEEIVREVLYARKEAV